VSFPSCKGTSQDLDSRAILSEHPGMRMFVFTAADLASYRLLTVKVVPAWTQGVGEKLQL